MLILPFHCIDTSKGNDRWLEYFNFTWPGYQQWFLREGAKARPGYLSSISAFEAVFPELLPVYKELCELVDGSDLKSRYLSMYNPPPYMSGCSQVAWNREHAGLVRNYDYGHRYFESVLLKSNWLKPVMGISDCNWGLLDGINEDGLVASLTFGGRKLCGEGFGIPLIIRYVLETCSTTKEAIKKLKPIKAHMAYNVTLIDKSNDFATLYFIPDKKNKVKYDPVGTNHQGGVHWPDYAKMTQTVERKNLLDELIEREDLSRNELIHSFLKPPLYNTMYEKSFGTLYTAAYAIDNKSVELIWPNKRRQLYLDAFEEMSFNVKLQGAASHRMVF